MSSLNSAVSSDNNGDNKTMGIKGITMGITMEADRRFDGYESETSASFKQRKKDKKNKKKK